MDNQQNNDNVHHIETVRDFSKWMTEMLHGKGDDKMIVLDNDDIRESASAVYNNLHKEYETLSIKVNQHAEELDAINQIVADNKENSDNQMNKFLFRYAKRTSVPLYGLGLVMGGIGMASRDNTIFEVGIWGQVGAVLSFAGLGVNAMINTMKNFKSFDASRLEILESDKDKLGHAEKTLNVLNKALSPQ